MPAACHVDSPFMEILQMLADISPDVLIKWKKYPHVAAKVRLILNLSKSKRAGGRKTWHIELDCRHLETERMSYMPRKLVCTTRSTWKWACCKILYQAHMRFVCGLKRIPSCDESIVQRWKANPDPHATQVVSKLNPIHLINPWSFCVDTDNLVFAWALNNVHW